MTVEEFCIAVVTVRRKYRGRITSWGRSVFFKIGFPDDPHEWDLAVDMIYPEGPNRVGSTDHPKFPQSCPHCAEENLRVIHEKGCDHYQPFDFPAGPTKMYAGVTKNWA